MAQSVKHPALAQVMILQFVGLSPMSGSVWTAQSLEPSSDSVCLPLSLLLPRPYCLSLKNKTLKKKESVPNLISFPLNMNDWGSEKNMGGEHKNLGPSSIYANNHVIPIS